jgi:hypothetical protein
MSLSRRRLIATAGVAASALAGCTVPDFEPLPESPTGAEPPIGYGDEVRVGEGVEYQLM